MITVIRMLGDTYFLALAITRRNFGRPLLDARRGAELLAEL